MKNKNNEIISKIHNEFNNVTFTFITHSMGILVFIWFILNENNKNFINLINKAIFIGGPANGSISAAKSLFGFGNEIFVSPKQIKMFSNDENVKSISELLPRNKKAVFYKNNKPVKIYDIVDEINDVNRVNIKYGITTATELFNKISNYKADFECISIIGITNNKFTNYLTIDDDYNMDEYVTFNGSDGTLSVDESVFNLSKKYYYISGGHTRLAENKETLEILEKELKDISLNYISLSSEELIVDIFEHKKIDSRIIIKLKIYLSTSITDVKNFVPRRSYFYGTKLQRIQLLDCRKNFKIIIKDELKELKFGFLIFKNVNIIHNNKIMFIDIFSKPISFLTIL